jgi:hypothetical protein
MPARTEVVAVRALGAGGGRRVGAAGAQRAELAAGTGLVSVEAAGRAHGALGAAVAGEGARRAREGLRRRVQALVAPRAPLAHGFPCDGSTDDA